ncbi:MAG: cupin domain-containing protein [Bacteroidetes bacterium]|nr:cupin domain-containing protein [Bacteroidota bacterium]
MIQAEIEKSKAVITVEIIEYEPHAVVSKTIINKTTGKVNVMSFDIGETLVETTIPFDSFVQIIEGRAEIVIADISHNLETGESMIIPAHTSNIVRANERFKMILTVIKSGYES